jgi:hypothetical protein
MTAKVYGFTVPLPPAEPDELVRWLRTAATAVNNAVPVLRAYHIKLRVRAGVLDDEDRGLADVMAALVELLSREGLLNASRVADVDAKWDRVIPTGQVAVTIRTALPPRHRIGAETRAKISKACTREARATRGNHAEVAAR